MNADWLYRLAARLAPADRRDWVAAMQAESEYVTENRLAWAAGCLVMAFKQRITLMTRSQPFHQIAIRYLPGGLIAAFGVGLVVAVVMLLMRKTGWIADGRSAMPLIVSIAAAIPMVIGGVAVIASDRSRLARVAGRWIFALGGLITAAQMFVVWLSRLSHGPMTLTATGSWTPLVTGGLFVAASPALLLGRVRTFLALTLAVLGVQLVQWAARLPALPYGLRYSAYIFNFLGACLPSLMLLAATGLILQARRTPPSV